MGIEFITGDTRPIIFTIIRFLMRYTIFVTVEPEMPLKSKIDLVNAIKSMAADA